jgi:hypothetical protein
MNFLQAAKAGNKVNKVLDDVTKQFEGLTGSGSSKKKNKEGGKEGADGEKEEKEQKRWFDAQRKERERKAEYVSTLLSWETINENRIL